MDGPRVEAMALDETVRALSEVWPAFRARAGPTAPFLHPGYLALWAERLGKDVDPRVLVARDGDSVVGFAPFMITEDAFGPWTVATARFLGNNVGYPGDVLYGDVLATPPREPVVRAILRAAKAWKVGKWDLGYLSPSSPTAALAQKLLHLGPSDAPAPPPQPYVSLDLPGDWDAYLATLSANTRHHFRRKLRRLDALGPVVVRVVRDRRGVQRRVAELTENHRRWSTGTAREGWFGGEVDAFLSEAADLLARQGEYLAFALEVDGVPIAWNAGAFDGARYFEQMISYDRAYREHSPGMLLGVLAVRELLALGARRIELGPGFDERKESMGGLPTAYARVLGYRGWARPLAQLHRAWNGRRAS